MPAREHAGEYYLYRLYNCVPEDQTAQFYICRGNPEASFTATPIQFQLTPSGRADGTATEAVPGSTPVLQ